MFLFFNLLCFYISTLLTLSCTDDFTLAQISLDLARGRSRRGLTYFREAFGKHYFGHKRVRFHRTLAIRQSLSHRLRVSWVDLFKFRSARGCFCFFLTGHYWMAYFHIIWDLLLPCGLIYQMELLHALYLRRFELMHLIAFLCVWASKNAWENLHGSFSFEVTFSSYQLFGRLLWQSKTLIPFEIVASENNFEAYLTALNPSHCFQFRSNFKDCFGGTKLWFLNYGHSCISSTLSLFSGGFGLGEVDQGCVESLMTELHS